MNATVTTALMYNIGNKPGTYQTQELPCHCGPGPHMFKVYSP